MGLNELVAAWNAHDPHGVAEQFTPDGVRHQYARPEVHLSGRDLISRAVAGILYALPDARLEVRSLSAGADGRFTMEWTLVGTHQRGLPGLPARGATIALPGVSIYLLDSDGRIRSEEAYWDMATLLNAAGMVS